MVEPRYYTVNDRPVQLIPTAEGGLDAQALDISSGQFIVDRSYFARVSDLGKDVQLVDEVSFRLLVTQIRSAIAAALIAQPLRWFRRDDGEHPYETDLNGCRYTIRVNDFPAEPLYTLLVGEEPLADLEDWPSAWQK